MFSFNSDPLQEEKYTVLPGLVHKYSDRILVEMNFTCPVVCEFCTRKRKGINHNDFELDFSSWLEMEKYILSKPKIREIILSGGEPLINTELLIKILMRIKKIGQIKIVRIHTRLPITAPDRISKKFLTYLDKETKERPIYISIHCDHQKELTDGAKEAIIKLRNGGAILYSQSVLLKNYNDTVNDLKELFESLLELGVRPYYLYQCDKIVGWRKFRVPFLKEVWLVKGLNRRISGLACPIFVVDSDRYKKRFY
jgi:lysine 2,3-aminomutase